MSCKEFFKLNWRKTPIFLISLSIILVMVYPNLQKNPMGINTGVIGRTYGISDVGFPDYPLYDYSVIAMPESHLNNWSRVGPYWEKKMESADSPIVFKSTVPNGYYALELSPGAYVVCFLKGDTTKGGYIIQRCAEVSFSLHETVQVDFTTSVGGYHISCPSDKCQEYNLEYAKKLKDEIICSFIFEPYYRKICYEDLAVLKLDKNVCIAGFSKSKTSGYLGRCYGLIAAELMDSTICEEFTDVHNKVSCYQEFSNAVISISDASLCEKAGTEKKACYFGIALNTKNPTLCKSVSRPDSCYREIAQSTGDETLCEKIIDIEYKEYCYKDIAYNTGNYSLCEKAGSYRNNCYINLAAYKFKDSSLCGKISEDDLRTINLCYKLVAIETKNSSLCDVISDRSLREECLIQLRN